MITANLGDITTISAGAIVNSANPSLLAGGGVCGAIQRAAGPELEAACRAVGKIEPGQAVVTPAFKLPAKFVIHAVAPRYLDGSRGEAETLRHTYVSICKIIEDLQITDVTLPSLGTGVYRFPLDLAAHIACSTLGEQMPCSCAATFVCFDKETLAAYELALEKKCWAHLAKN
jgi:O-acetyl-ADP-ribose deacetylase (regulator of RNase III)